MALRGSIDVLSHRRIVGWAWETDAPETPVAVLIAIDRRVLGRCKADLFREDLAVHGIGTGRCGFAMSITAGDCQEFRVEAAIVDSKEVPDGTTQSTPHP